MEGMVRTLKKEEEDVDVDAMGTEEGHHMHPLLIPQVARTIFSSLGRNDPLSARRVCREWHVLGTETYKNRKDILHHMSFCLAEMAYLKDVMAPSPRMPVVRWNISIGPVSVPSTDLLQNLSFIAPSVKSLAMGVDLPRPLNQKFCMNAQVLNTLDLSNLVMPELEVLDILTCCWIGVPAYEEAVARVFHRIVAGAGALRSFRCCFPLKQTILEALPRGLEKLAFSGVFEGNAYAVLMTSGFQLTELMDDRTEIDGLTEFLYLQKESLRRLNVAKLEEVYDQFGRSSSFPQLKFVTKLECDVNCNSTFRFLCAFPNLVELTVNVRVLKPPTASQMVEIENELSSLPQHLSVRTLHISMWGDEVPPELDQVIVFGLFGHCFPNLTHLSIPMNGSAGWMRGVFTEFQNLESLYINVYYEDIPPRELETLVSGIPAPVCDAMREAGNYDDSVFGGEESRFEPGLANLKRLRTLEVHEADNRFQFLFTPLMYHRVFSRMTSLKEICFMEEDVMYVVVFRIPEACLPFVEPLRARGIELYIMKREIDIHLDF